MTSKERSKLRAIANNYECIYQIGKGGITENVIKTTVDALRAREMIKLKVLETCEYSSYEAATILAAETESDVVQVIGTKFILYKKNPKSPKIVV